MKLWLSALALSCCLFAIHLRSQAEKIARQESLIAKLEKEQMQPRVPTLEAQAACTKQAEISIKSMKLEQKEMVEYTSHYNPKLGHCFVKRYGRQDGIVIGDFSVSASLYDAFESKDYGGYILTYVQLNYKPRQFSDCEVVSADGVDTPCSSPEEFDELSKFYME